VAAIQTSPARLILASASPRRHQLLTEAGVSFQVVESGIAEDVIAGENAADYALRVASDKAIAVSARMPDDLVLAADTVVECGGKILGKPADQAEARAMLQTLSGRTHRVITAFALARSGRILESDSVASRVTFRKLSAPEIEAYVASGEPLDKAGAYGIQDKGGEFIAAVEGSRDNVMGLPTREVLAMLERHGVRSHRAER
jgi:septum formation protein